jgi:hypothetical protein
MYLCGKAIHVSRRAGKASKQLLGTPPGGYRRNVVEVQQHTTFPVDSRLPGVFQIAKWDSVPTSRLVGSFASNRLDQNEPEIMRVASYTPCLADMRGDLIMEFRQIDRS